MSNQLPIPPHSLHPPSRRQRSLLNQCCLPLPQTTLHIATCPLYRSQATAHDKDLWCLKAVVTSRGSMYQHLRPTTQHQTCLQHLPFKTSQWVAVYLIPHRLRRLYPRARRYCILQKYRVPKITTRMQLHPHQLDKIPTRLLRRRLPTSRRRIHMRLHLLNRNRNNRNNCNNQSFNLTHSHSSMTLLRHSNPITRLLLSRTHSPHNLLRIKVLLGPMKRPSWQLQNMPSGPSRL